MTPPVEDPDYLSRQLITYIGNKRALLPTIDAAVERVRQELGRPKLRILDAFSGSGVVSRFLRSSASYLASNDLEGYAALLGRCFLRNRDPRQLAEAADAVARLNACVDGVDLPRGFIEELYAPRDESDIRPGDRVFYTRDNARRLDNYRRMLDGLPLDIREMLLGPLLGRASVHANTSGVFKGFYKDRETGIGRYGGSGGDALTRILGRIVLEVPILSRFDCDVSVSQMDAGELVRQNRGFDLIYVDPPYNQHPYGSNYFMLNLLADYRRPANISEVSGIPADWRRSGYNVRREALPLLRQLLVDADASFALISYNDEGFISREAMETMLADLGRVERIETKYNAFRGSRNLSGRKTHVTERLFLLRKGGRTRVNSSAAFPGAGR